MSRKNWKLLVSMLQLPQPMVGRIGEKDVVNSIASGVPAAGDKIWFDDEQRTVEKNSTRYYINGKQYKSEEAFEDALADGEYTVDDVYVTVDVAESKAVMMRWQNL